MLRVSSEIQVVLSQITQLQSEIRSLSARVDELEATEAGGDGFGSRMPGQDYIGGDGGTLEGNTSDSVPVGGDLRFRSAADANVVVRTLDGSDSSDDSSDDSGAVVEIGVYYA